MTYSRNKLSADECSSALFYLIYSNIFSNHGSSFRVRLIKLRLVFWGQRCRPKALSYYQF